MNFLLIRHKLSRLVRPHLGGIRMRKRGRVSAAAIGVTPVGISAKERPAPPTGLTARERRQWNEITGALRPDWFEAENLPLLAEYVRTAELCTRLARELRNVEVCDPRFAGLSRQRNYQGRQRRTTGQMSE
jgi:hypothetical protein